MKNYNKPLTKKDEFNATGNFTITFKNTMEAIDIRNWGNEDITFITNTQIHTLKAGKGLYENIDSFNRLEIQVSPTYVGNIDGYVLGRF
ncbi:hypothetical protein U6M79_12320 [Cutibacterium acnes]